MSEPLQNFVSSMPLRTWMTFGCPPSNRLHLLRGKLNGYYALRINDQWRIVFRWKDGGAEDVKITDHH